MTTAASAPLHGSNTAVATTAAVAAATTQVAAAQTRTNRRKVKDFNDSITCSLCSGYLIEATTVNDCLHTFCRSCIVRYLECNKYCPKCKSYNNKTITVANLRPDRILKSLVYKLVPGLYKSENQRVTRFYTDQDPGSPGGNRKVSPEHGLLEDQNFFSPDELISLSLEYHYESIADYDPKTTRLPVTYLHCPAAVTIHHLYKFILTKNGLQVDNERIQVDIIYEDEILPHEFTLMDVAYCFDYKRVSPMRLFYRIFIHPTAKPPATTAVYNVGSRDKNSNENNNSSNNNNNSSGERDANNSESNLNESQGSAESSSSPSSSSSSSSSATTTVSPGKGDVAESTTHECAVVKSVNSELSVKPSEQQPVQASGSSYKSVESSYDSKLIITKTNKADKGANGGEKESLKLVLVTKKSDKNSSKVIYSKSEAKSSKSPKQNSPTASSSSSPSTTSSPGDFKRLRSSDIRYSDYETASTSFAASSSKSGTVPGDDSRKSESHSAKKHNKINNDYTNTSDSSGKKFSGDNSRNKTNGSAARNGASDATLVEAKSKHEKSKSSPHRSESNGAAVAITASTGSSSTTTTTRAEKNQKSSELKCYVNLKKQMVVSQFSSSVETSANRKPEVPKLKIELPSLKTKISIPKQDSNERSPRSAHSSSASSSAATSPTASSSTSGKSPIWPKADDKPTAAANVNSIGIEEYAKTIGLKPVYKLPESGGGGSEGGKKKKKSSTSSSPDPPFHRKRKKAKHSKGEAGSGKRRKLHAEISSQHDESLKMKVKLTEKPSKHERKPSEEIATPKEPPKQNAEVTPSSSAVTQVAAPIPKEDDPKVIDITKGDDDDDVKIIEQPTLPAPLDEPVKLGGVTESPAATRVNELPKLPVAVAENSTKAKINEMRAIRHKPMVYIPNPIDKNLSDTSSSINSLIQSVQAKTGFIDKDNDVQIVSTSQPVKMPPLVPTKPVTVLSSMKPPTVIPRIAASNSIPKPQQKLFSPRHTPNYPPLALQSAPKKVAVTPISSTNIYQPRSSVPALKRSSSVDSGSTYNIPPKTPRVDLMEANAQSRLMKKPCYAPMFNFVKGASLAKNGTTNSMPTSANDVPYKSPISSTYTKEMSTKKSVPSLLLPPSSISVTKMCDVAPQPAPVDHRPALEIVRIPSTAPVADKPQPKATVSPKTTRPLPPTIPLIKIKKSASVGEHPMTSPISPSVFQVTSSSTNSSTNLTTSSASSQDASSGALDLTTRANDDLIILESSDSLTSKLNGNDSKQKQQQQQPSRVEFDSNRLELINSLIQTSAASMIKAGPSMMAKLQGGIPGLKLPSDMIGFAITSSSSVPKLTGVTYSSTLPATTISTKSIPMPKLAEISRPKLTATARQPNPSVRNIPNPSALAFRNQTIASFPSSSSSTITSLSPTSPPARVMNVNMKINNANTTNTKPSVNNGSDSFLSRTQHTSAPPSDVDALSFNLNGANSSNNNNNNNGNSVNNNKSDGVSSTSGNSSKKTIEKVAAGLRAAAATATSQPNVTTNGNRVSSSNGTAPGGIGKNGVNVV